MEQTLNGTNIEFVLVEDPYYHDSCNPNSSGPPEPYSNGSEPNSKTHSPNNEITYMEPTLNESAASFSDPNFNSPAELYSNISEPDSISPTPNDGTTYTEPTLNGTAVDDALIVEMTELMRQK